MTTKKIMMEFHVSVRLSLARTCHSELRGKQFLGRPVVWLSEKYQNFFACRTFVCSSSLERE